MLKCGNWPLPIKVKIGVSFSIYTYSEFVLGNAILEDDESRIASIFNEVVHGSQSMLFYKKWWHTHLGFSENGRNWPYRVFLTTTNRPDCILSSRDEFIGSFRTYSNPIALEKSMIPETNGSGKSLAGVLQWRIKLAPGESWNTKLSIGIQANEDSEANYRAINELKKPETYVKAFEKTTAYWNGLFGVVEVKTPDEDINNMVNYWNKYQLM